MVLSPSPRASLTGTIKKIGVDAEQGGSGASADQECGRWLNNRAENSHQPFRRRAGGNVEIPGREVLVEIYFRSCLDLAPLVGPA